MCGSVGIMFNLMCVSVGILPEGADSVGRLCKAEVRRQSGRLSMALGPHEEIYTGTYMVQYGSLLLL